MRAAAQQQQGKMAHAPTARLALVQIDCDVERALPTLMTAPMRAPREFIIKGLTQDGRTFRPSDWAERLAGAMSSFRPGAGGRAGIGAFIGYSLLRAYLGGRGQGCDRQRGTARHRADGLGFRRQLRARQQPSDGQDAEPAHAADLSGMKKAHRGGPSSAPMYGVRRPGPGPLPWQTGDSCGGRLCSCGTCPCQRPSRSPSGPS